MIKTYFDRYTELQKQYKIATSRDTMVRCGKTEDDYDVIIERCGRGYAHVKYRVVKNAPGLSEKDLAIICDGGNLCFGYRTEGNIICIHID